MTNTTNKTDTTTTAATQSVQQITTIIIEIAAKQGGVAVDSVSPATHFQNDLNYDSLDAVEFAMGVEDALGVKIPDEKVAELTTVQTVIDYVTAQR